jgi:hypothetical protein
VAVIDAAGAASSWDPFVRAAGVLRAANVPGPYAVIAHPYALTALELLKETGESAKALTRPEGSRCRSPRRDGRDRGPSGRVRVRPWRGSAWRGLEIAAASAAPLSIG